MKPALTLLTLIACFTFKPVQTNAVDVGVPFERMKAALAKAYIMGMEEQRMYSGNDINGLVRLTEEQVLEIIE